MVVMATYQRGRRECPIGISITAFLFNSTFDGTGVLLFVAVEICWLSLARGADP